MIPLNGNWDAGYTLGAYYNPDGTRTLLGESSYQCIYQREWYILDTLARWIVDGMNTTQDFKDINAFAAIPERRKRRDLDPHHHMINWISYLLKCGEVTHALVREGDIPEFDTGISTEDVCGSMHITDQSQFIGKNVLLFDGIICSGIALHLATQALRNAGAKTISVIALTKLEEAPTLHIGAQD